jgi:sulfur-carrier protein
MKCSLLLFARARDLAGKSSVELDVPSEFTIRDLRGHVSTLFPELSVLHGNLIWAVNNQYAADNYQLQPDDIVACFPPVSGG